MIFEGEDLDKLEAEINLEKVTEIVVDALQEILPHAMGASTADVMMAYAVMIKTTLVGMEISDIEKERAKALFDHIWPGVLVDRLTKPEKMDLLH